MENNNEGTVTIGLQRYKELEKFEQDYQKEYELLKSEMASKYQEWEARYKELTKSKIHAQNNTITKLENMINRQEAGLKKVRATWFTIGFITMSIIVYVIILLN